MRNTKNAFTLVELIVVITILAILGTIAFISLQGYSADARNSKRTSDLGNIQSAISLKQVEGVPLMSFITTGNAKMDTIALGGATAAAISDGTYDAGTPAYTVLNVVAKDFKDPQDKEYRIGATTKSGGAFQIAASIEVDGTPEALVNGTFNDRDTTAQTVKSKDTTTITLVDTAANTFKAGDSVTLSLGGASTVNKVSRDGVTLTMSVVGTGTGTIALVVAESTGLIESTNGSSEAVVNGSGATLAY